LIPACALSLLALAGSAHAAPAPAPPPSRPAGTRPATTPSAKRSADAQAADASGAELHQHDDERPISIAVVGGYGLIIDDAGTEGINPLRTGFGVRGGYAVGPLYFGTRFLFFLGQKRGAPDGSERSADEWLVGLEAGYGYTFGPLILRSELGFGLAFSSSEAVLDQPMPEPVDTSSTDPYLELGLVVELNIARDVFFGVQGRAVAVLAKQAVRGNRELIGIPLLAACGMRF
jgi:hypothetical protein